MKKKKRKEKKKSQAKQGDKNKRRGIMKEKKTSDMKKGVFSLLESHTLHTRRHVSIIV